MWKSMKELEDIIISAPGDDLDVVRYCLSDKVSLSIDKVVVGDVSPIEYANRTIEKHYQDLYNKFYKTKTSSTKLPEPFIKAFMFERLLLNAIYLRIAAIKPQPINQTSTTCVSVSPSILITTARHIPYINYVGFCDYKFTVESFIDYNSYDFKTGQIPLLRRFAKIISSIENDDWLFHDSKWQKACLNKSDRLTTMRKFLYTVIVSYIIPDNHLPAIFGVERSTILKFMDEFIEIRESSNVKVEDIVAFIYELSTYFIDVSSNIHHTNMLYFSFSDLKNYLDNPHFSE